MKMSRTKNSRAAKALCCYLIVALFAIGFAENSYAGFSSSEAMNVSPVERAADLNKIQAALDTKVVNEKLTQLGFSKEEIQTRLDQLSDQQLHKVAQEVDELKVGGDGGFIIGVLVIAVLVVLFVYLFKRA